MLRKCAEKNDELLNNLKALQRKQEEQQDPQRAEDIRNHEYHSRMRDARSAIGSHTFEVVRDVVEKSLKKQLNIESAVIKPLKRIQDSKRDRKQKSTLEHMLWIDASDGVETKKVSKDHPSFEFAAVS
eukprot:SAG31_NODE_1888_length_6987_cov_1.481852_2_plen_128_part_00